MKTTLAVIALTLLASAPATADEALARSKGCIACHAMDKKVIGPSFRDIGARYAKDPAAADKLANKILQGSSRAWGMIDMPANPHVSAEDAKKMATWISGLK